jgi:tetratricopeptide (TPR) repeat protein
MPAVVAGEAAEVVGILAKMLGPAPSGSVFRVISSARAGNIVAPGALVLSEQVFRRDALATTTIETIADAVARLWIDGRVKLRGQEARATQEGGPPRKPRSAAFLRDSLPRYLAALYVEEKYGKADGNEAFSRMRWTYTPVAQSGRDAELGIQTLVLPNYTAAVFAKGPLVLRLLAETVGRDRLIAAIKELTAGPQTKIVTTDDFRAIVNKAGPDGERVFAQWIDTIIEPDVIVGAPLPSDKPGVQNVNLRNLGTGDATLKLVATTASGKQVAGTVTVPSENITTAEIQTSEKITALEIDPEKLLIQTNYDNDARDGDFKSTRTSAQTLFNQSLAAFNKSQFGEAETRIREALTRDPSNPLIHAWLARTLAAANKLDEATREANAALETRPPVASAAAWARITLGQVALARNQANQAVEPLRRALAEAEETPAQFAVRELLIKAERAANASPPVDEKVRAYVTSLDAAIKQLESDRLFTLIMRNNLKRFVQGITVSRPSLWTTEILRADRIDANRVALDVRISAKSEGRDQAGTAVLVLYRAASGWMLEDVQLFDVK